MVRLLTILGIASYALVLLIVPVLIARLPADYFVAARPGGAARNPLVRWTLLVVRNLLGVAMIAAGILLIPLPGQGFLTLLLGLTFVTFPGKRRMEQRLVAWKPVRAVAQWIRMRAGKPPLLIPSAPPPASGGAGARAPEAPPAHP